MSSLLIIASRIQAAAEAYASVKKHTNVDKWRAQFQNEKAKSVEAFIGLRMANPNMPAPDLHAKIVALALVLNEEPENQDFSLIVGNFPQDQLLRNKFYNPLAEFPADLSGYLPPREDWWWEELAAESRLGQTRQEPVTSQDDAMHVEPAAFGGQAAPASAAPEPAAPEVPESPEAPPVAHLEVPSSPAASEEPAIPEVPPLRIKIKIPSRKPIRSTPQEDTNMAVDEQVKRRRKRKAADNVAPPKSSKRPTPASQSQTQASGESEVDELEWEPPFDVKFECEKCVAKGIICEPRPTSACKRCHGSKLGCSLMPRDDETGKPNRKALSAKFVFEYRLRQQKGAKSLSEGQKGRKNFLAREVESQPEASGSGVSPTSLILNRMTLESESSKGNSPVPSPASGMGSSALFSVEIPRPPTRTPRVLVPPFKTYRQPSPTALSQSSDDGRNLRARVKELEETVEGLKKDVAALKEAAGRK